MKLFFAVLGTLGLWSIVLAFINLGRLTKKWEVVTRSTSYYRLFYAAAALVALASLARLVRIGYQGPVADPNASAVPAFFCEPQSWFYLSFYYCPLAFAVTISMVLAWKNWGWLLRERGR